MLISQKEVVSKLISIKTNTNFCGIITTVFFITFDTKLTARTFIQEQKENESFIVIIISIMIIGKLY